MPQTCFRSNFKKNLLTGFLFFVLLAACTTSVHAQKISEELDLSDTTQVHMIITRVGDRYVGRILSIENTNVQFLFKDEIKLQFDLDKIKEIRVLDLEKIEKERERKRQKRAAREPGKVHGHENLFPYIIPTGFALKKGETELRNLGILAFSVDHGLDDHFSVGADLVPIPWLLIIPNVRMKASESLGKNLHLSGSINLTGVFISWEEPSTLFNASGALTVGSPEQFFNISAGLVKPLEKNAAPRRLLTAGGAFLLGKDLQLSVTTMYTTWVNETNRTFIAGVQAKWFTTKHRVEGGWVLVGRTPVPFASYAYRFGTGRKRVNSSK